MKFKFSNSSFEELKEVKCGPPASKLVVMNMAVKKVWNKKWNIINEISV